MPLSSAQRDRAELLRNLVECKRSPEVLSRSLRNLEWDGAPDLVSLTPSDLLRTLRLYQSGELTAAEVAAWADLLEGRDDVAFASDLVVAVLNVLANPETQGALSTDRAHSLVVKLSAA